MNPRAHNSLEMLYVPVLNNNVVGQFDWFSSCFSGPRLVVADSSHCDMHFYYDIVRTLRKEATSRY